jgi:hypothetical protein
MDSSPHEGRGQTFIIPVTHVAVVVLGGDNLPGKSGVVIEPPVTALMRIKPIAFLTLSETLPPAASGAVEGRPSLNTSLNFSRMALPIEHLSVVPHLASAGATGASNAMETARAASARRMVNSLFAILKEEGDVEATPS